MNITTLNKLFKEYIVTKEKEKGEYKLHKDGEFKARITIDNNLISGVSTWADGKTIHNIVFNSGLASEDCSGSVWACVAKKGEFNFDYKNLKEMEESLKCKTKEDYDKVLEKRRIRKLNSLDVEELEHRIERLNKNLNQLSKEYTETKDETILNKIKRRQKCYNEFKEILKNKTHAPKVNDNKEEETMANKEADNGIDKERNSYKNVIEQGYTINEEEYTTNETQYTKAKVYDILKDGKKIGEYTQQVNEYVGCPKEIMSWYDIKEADKYLTKEEVKDDIELLTLYKEGLKIEREEKEFETDKKKGTYRSVVNKDLEEVRRVQNFTYKNSNSKVTYKHVEKLTHAPEVIEPALEEKTTTVVEKPAAIKKTQEVTPAIQDKPAKTKALKTLESMGYTIEEQAYSISKKYGTRYNILNSNGENVGFYVEKENKKAFFKILRQESEKKEEIQPAQPEIKEEKMEEVKPITQQEQEIDRANRVVKIVTGKDVDSSEMTFGDFLNLMEDEEETEQEVVETNEVIEEVEQEEVAHTLTAQMERCIKAMKINEVLQRKDISKENLKDKVRLIRNDLVEEDSIVF